MATPSEIAHYAHQIGYRVNAIKRNIEVILNQYISKDPNILLMESMKVEIEKEIDRIISRKLRNIL